MTTERAPVVAAETPDQRLHQDLLAQAPGAVEALVHRYGVKIYRLALRITGNPEDAQEVSQDVLWTIVRKMSIVQGRFGLGELDLPDHRQRGVREAPQPARQGPGLLGGPLARLRPGRPPHRARPRLDTAGGGSRASGRSAPARSRKRSTASPRTIARPSSSTTWRACRTRRSARCSASACPQSSRASTARDCSCVSAWGTTPGAPEAPGPR